MLPFKILKKFSENLQIIPTRGLPAYMFIGIGINGY